MEARTEAGEGLLRQPLIRLPNGWVNPEYRPEGEAPSVSEGSFLDDLLRELFTGSGEIRLPGPEPGYPEGGYRILAVPQGCPNIAVTWSPTSSANPLSGWLTPCIACDNFPCEGCETGGDYHALARAVIGAILAGRQVRALSTNRIVSSLPPQAYGNVHQYLEVDRYGERSEEQEAGTRHPEEPQAERGEEIRYVAAADPATQEVAVPLIRIERRPLPGGTVEFRGDDVYVRDASGAVIRTMSFAEMWATLANPIRLANPEIRIACTGRFGPDGTLQHDDGTCPIHEVE